MASSSGNWLSGWMRRTWIVVELGALRPESTFVAGLPDLGLRAG